ncbi:MAG: STAS domain-containing protein [Kiritimatiellae bacterium]|nr:STAS domain-containing protein [Kiritimatiellia bacterium]
MSDRKIEINMEVQGDITVVTISGALDSSNLRRFKSELDPLFNESDNHVVMDCSNLSYASSQVFGLLSCYNKTSHAKNRYFALCNVSSQMYNILDILGLIPVFRLFENRDEAFNEIQRLIVEK